MISDLSLGSDESKDVGQHNKEEIKKETSKLEVESEEIKEETSRYGSEEIKEKTGAKFDRYKRSRFSGVNGGETYESENLKKISTLSYDELFILLDDYTISFEERMVAIKAFEKYMDFSDPEGDECSIGEICGGSGCQGCCGPSEDEEEEVESKKKKIKIEKE